MINAGNFEDAQINSIELVNNSTVVIGFTNQKELTLTSVDLRAFALSHLIPSPPRKKGGSASRRLPLPGATYRLPRRTDLP